MRSSSRDEGLGTRLISVWACVGVCGHVIHVGMHVWVCVGMCGHVWACVGSECKSDH